MTGKTDEFVYEPLDYKNQDAIRLLRVHGINKSGRIMCTLRHTRIPDASMKLNPSNFSTGENKYKQTKLDEQYIAVSYVWSPEGDLGTTRGILVNDKKFRVRQNIHNFLWQIARCVSADSDLTLIGGRMNWPSWCRDDQPYDASNWKRKPLLAFHEFWIDAICLNQNDHTERNHQVQCMTQIYRAARSVLVWLGQGDSTVSRWLTGLNEFYDSCAGRDGSVTQASWNDPGLHCLLDSKYWTRTWIVPELLASRETMLIYANFSMHWDVLWYHGRTSLQKDFYSTFAGKYYIRVQGTYNRIITLLNRYLRTECENSRDRIYSLLAYVKGGNDFEVRYEETLQCLAVRAALYFEEAFIDSMYIIMGALGLPETLDRQQWATAGLVWYSLRHDPYTTVYPTATGEIWKLLRRMMGCGTTILALCLYPALQAALRLSPLYHVPIYCFYIDWRSVETRMLGPVTPENVSAACRWLDSLNVRSEYRGVWTPRSSDYWTQPGLNLI